MKTNLAFVCTECNYQTKKWQGRCSGCGAWNSLVETMSTFESPTFDQSIVVEPVSLLSIDLSEQQLQPVVHIPLQEVECVIGKALLPGSLVLMGGEPGIGKSTLVLQFALYLGANQKMLYISGEESLGQLRLRAERLGITQQIDCLMLADVDLIADYLQRINKGDMSIVVIDSLHTLYSSRRTGGLGGIAQIKYAIDVLRRIAKEKNILLLIIGHITKEGDIAGPKTLEHMVDAVFYLEGERDTTIRFLRSVKNRYDAVNTLGVIEMTERGFKDVKDPGSIFWSKGELDIGSSLGMVKQGKRVFVCEVQALVVATDFGYPRRTSLGIDLNRLHLILAVLQRHLNLKFNTQDVYVKLKGGLAVSDPHLDAALAMALVSAYKKEALPSQQVFVGEIELNGKIVLHDKAFPDEAKKRALNLATIQSLQQFPGMK
ncbi:MAG: DNA repair protein RadA [Candidatus Abawacabacteria bacterium]|nr:DNA repair protein RadA [Candidatus Abawacabacteria bacterium]